MARSIARVTPRVASVALAATLAFAPACDDGTAFLVEVDLDAGVAAPEFLLVTWFDSNRLIGRDEPVPDTGVLDPTRRPLATVLIDIGDSDGDKNRRLFVRAVRGQTVTARAVARVAAVPGRWVRVPLTLSAALPDDGDADGVPDEIDVCVGDDFAGCPAR